MIPGFWYQITQYTYNGCSHNSVADPGLLSLWRLQKDCTTIFCLLVCDGCRPKKVFIVTNSFIYLRAAVAFMILLESPQDNTPPMIYKRDILVAPTLQDATPKRNNFVYPRGLKNRFYISGIFHTDPVQKLVRFLAFFFLHILDNISWLTIQ